ncbi:MAG: cyclic pyranopterin monophosphate synthase MoaC [Anaerolineaceae bacterium]|jgi:cyclic pyranopterin phosphate synthase|nr:cyclic pyranopterin monophosphate synthase MoaC [Anaerolineaceae bacterium]
MTNEKLTHLDSNGNAQMVDVGEKPITHRMAKARGQVVLLPTTVEMINKGLMKKGDVLTVAKIAGIQAAKKTSELIPLCHPLIINKIEVELHIDEALPGIQIEATVITDGKTGVEMEALTAVSVTALTIYDMIKAVEKSASIENIRLVEKRGGMSGYVFNE